MERRCPKRRGTRGTRPESAGRPGRDGRGASFGTPRNPGLVSHVGDWYAEAKRLRSMSDCNWYYRIDGNEHGPIVRDELAVLAANGKLRLTDHVRLGKRGTWVHPSESLFSREQLASALSSDGIENAAGEENTTIGGWLVLPLIGLVLSPILTIGVGGQELEALQSPIWPDVERKYPGATLLVQSELVAFLFLVILDIVCLVMFLRRKRSTPRWMITLYALNVVAAIGVGAIGAVILPRTVSATWAGQALLSAIIWIAYFCKAKRVRATFVR